MPSEPHFVDIHCHLIPEIDDGAKSWEDSLAMAEMACDDGIDTIVVTPHQLGTFSHNTGNLIRQRTALLQQQLDQHRVPLRVLPGADVRIEEGMIEGILNGDVVTLADRRKHILLELPHELYFPIEGVLDKLRRIGVTGILSHPERNQGLLKRFDIVESLVDMGCLMQVTASSLIGGMGAGPLHMSQWMIEQGLVHFLATDAHGPKSRRPLMGRAFEQVVTLTDEAYALDICCHNPAQVAQGARVDGGRRRQKGKKRVIPDWFTWRKAG